MANWIFLTLKMGHKGCPETSVKNCHYSLRNSPEEWSIHFYNNLLISAYNSMLRIPGSVI
jgi:hypothetical protein